VRDPDVARAVALADAYDVVEARVALGARAVELDDERRADIRREAGVDGLIASGTGMTRSVIAVQMPSVPSEPTNAPSRS
jgi:hypothetical protein